MTDTGIYATAQRPDAGRFGYARACLSQGMSYAAAASAAGINEIDLRTAIPGFSPADRPPPQVRPRTPFERCAAILPLASPEECSQVAALALAMLGDLSGPSAVRLTVANVLTKLPALTPATARARARVVGREVAEFVAAAHGLTYADLCAPRRSRAYVRPRQIAMHTIKALCPHMSYPGIGRMLGFRDHTTVMHGDRRIAELVQTDPGVARAVADVFARFAPASEAAA